MPSLRSLLALALAVSIVCGVGTQELEPEGNYGVGIPSVFVPNIWRIARRSSRAAQSRRDANQLGYVKGLSTSFTSMVGEMAVDLRIWCIHGQPEWLTPGSRPTACGSSTGARATCRARCGVRAGHFSRNGNVDRPDRQFWV